MSQPCLLFSGKLIPLTGRTDFIIGRDERICQVFLNDSSVSRRHARITVQDGHYILTDLDSTNGTRVNGEDIREPREINPGDEISIRPYKLIYVMAGIEAELTFEQPGRKKRGPKPSSKGHFSGVLDSVSIADLIQFLGSTPESGILNIQDSNDNEGHLIIIKGEIAQADYQGKTGEEAVFALMGLKEADFFFEECNPPPPENPIKVSTISLLLEGCRRFDELSAKTQPIHIPKDV